MLYDLLRTLEDRNAVVSLKGGAVAVSPRRAAEGLEGALHHHRGELKTLLNRWGGGPARNLLDAYLTGFTLVQTQQELEETVRRLSASVSFSLDLETTGLNPRKDKVRLISLANEQDTFVIDAWAPGIDQEELKAGLKELFDGRRRVVLHNGVFDLSFLAFMGVEAHPGSIYDTGVAEQNLFASERVPPLQILAWRYLGLFIDKTLQTSNWSGPLTESQLRYAALDSRATYLIYKKQAPQLYREEVRSAAQIDFDAIPAVVWMRLNGVPIDLECWAAKVEEATVKTKAAYNRLKEMDPGVKWNSDTQALEDLRAKGYQLESVEAGELKKYAGDPLIDAYIEYKLWRFKRNAYGTNWMKYIDEDTSRVYPVWKPVGAKTGRMASAEPNVMSVTRDSGFRGCVRAPEGRVLIKADYSQIELRLGALIAGDPVMLEAFKAGRDLHTFMAAAITGKTPEEVTKAERQMAKAANFGFLYGLQAKGFKQKVFEDYGVELSIEEAERFRRVYLEQYPGIKAWHERQTTDLEDVRTLSGRRRFTEKINEKLNSPVQGSGADILKRALGLLYEWRAVLPGVFPILAVHDEIVVEAPLHLAGEAKKLLTLAMLQAAAEITGGGVPIEVEAGVYEDWGVSEVSSEAMKG